VLVVTVAWVVSAALASGIYPHLALAEQAKRPAAAKGAAKKPAAKKGPAKKGAAKKAAPKPSTMQGATESFEPFCLEWMQKLAVRERDNVAHIKWETNADGVHGSYTGYNQEHTCIVTEGTQKVPIGTIKYREVRYEKRGPSNAAAEQSQPQAVELFDVTEIFRYTKGKWDYR